MDILTFVVDRVKETSPSQLERIALATGVPYRTLIKIKYGDTKNPRISTVQPLLNYFQLRAA